MKSKISFFNKGILLNDLKRFLWLGIAYFVFLFFSIPVKILNIYDCNKIQINYHRYMNYIFSFDSSPLTFSICIVPVFVALILFRYIQNKKSIDMIHSLPITRKHLFDNHVFFGLMTLIMPVILISIICFLLKISLNLNDKNLHFTYNDVVYWAGITILLTTFIFLFTILIGMLTGLTAAQGILTYILLFLPYGLSILIFYNLKIIIYGFVYESYMETNFLFLSPITRLTNLKDFPMEHYEIITYIILSFTIFIIGRILYKKRKSEAISNVVAFKLLQPIFKYGLTFCCMLVGGMYFAYMEKNLSWIIFGYIIASFIGYIISEMIIKKSLKVFKNLKGYFIYSVVMVLIMVCINFDLISFQKRIPAFNEIESIFLEDNFFSLIKGSRKKPHFYKEFSNIEEIQKLHKDIISNKISYNELNSLKGNFQRKPVALMYKLKNGSTIKRQYIIPAEIYNKHFKGIYESAEYKIINNPILNKDSSSIDKISFHENYLWKNFSLTKPSEIKEFTDILKSEILNQAYDSDEYRKLFWSDINLSLRNDENESNQLKRNDYLKDHYDDTNFHYVFSQSYVKLQKWLTEKGYIEYVRTMPEDIDYAIIEKFNSTNKDIDLNNKNVKRLEIKDKTQIETCLRNTYTDNEGEYIIGFYSKNNHVFYGNLKKDNLPALVKDYFK